MIRFLLVVVCCVSHAHAQFLPEPGESVDAYLDRYEQWVETIPEDDRSWGMLEELLEDYELYEAIGSLESDPSQDGWKSTVDFVNAHPELVPQVRQLAGRACVGIPRSVVWVGEYDPESGPPSVYISLPHLGPLRQCQQLLLIDTRLAVEAGAFDRALRNIESIAGLQNQVSLAGSMIEGLVEISLGSDVGDLVLRDELRLGEWNEHQLDRLSVAISSLSAQETITDAAQFEHWSCLAVVEWVFVEAEDGRLTKQGAERFINMMEMMVALDDELIQRDKHRNTDRVALNAMLRSLVRVKGEQERIANDLFSQIQSDVSTPPHELTAFNASVRVNELSNDISRGVSYGPVVMFVPAFDRFYKRHVSAEVVLRASLARIDLEKHYKLYGMYPEATQGHHDPYSGESLKYKLVDGHPMIYSVGPDRDDDGGVPVVDARGDPVAWPEFMPLDDLDAMSDAERDAIDGDWVLYPAVNK